MRLSSVALRRGRGVETDGMKRILEPELPGPSLTPSKSAARFRRPPAKSVSKRPRYADLRGFCTPTILPDGTPATNANNAAPVSAWPSSAQHQLEKLGMNTPIDPLSDTTNANGTSMPNSVLGKHQNTEEHQDTEEFVLFSQSDYIRVSQAVLTPDATPEVQHSADTQVASTSVFAFHPASELAHEQGPALRLSQLLNTQPSVTSLVQVEPPRTRHGPSLPQHHVDLDLDLTVFHDSSSQPASTCFSEGHLSQPPAQPPTDTHAVTPELCCGAVVSSNSRQAEQLPPCPRSTPPLPGLFNIFLPRNVQRHLVIIRHGESEYNRAAHEGKDFKDPMIFDPHLTSLGVAQARSLRSKLQQQLQVHGQALWVVSPLRRAIQTFMEACPLLEREQACSSGGAGSSSGASSSGASSSSSLLSITPAAATHGGLNIELLPTISEFVVTAGDIGTPSSLLAKEFPMLAPQLGALPEHWWFQGPKKPNCALLKQFHAAEPKEHKQKRVSELARWLSTRPERFIILIGHCSFWHEFRGKTEKYMSNGEMRSMSW